MNELADVRVAVARVETQHEEFSQQSREDRRDLWNTINALRDLQNRNTVDQAGLIHKIDRFIDASAADAAARAADAEKHTALALRVSDIETARMVAAAARKVERRTHIKVLAAVSSLASLVTALIASLLPHWLSTK